MKKKGKFGDYIYFKGTCPTCITPQCRKLGKEWIGVEARELFKNYSYGEYKMKSSGNIENKDGGLFPPAIIGVISETVGAAATAAGTTAGIVLGVKENGEEETANKLRLEETTRKNNSEIGEMRRRNDLLLEKIKKKKQAVIKQHMLLVHRAGYK